jgi:transcriptional regulator with XRE-family HTH domain
MTDLTPARARLAKRLGKLRVSSEVGRLTQKELAGALGTSAPLISSWEGGKEIPPEARLEAYGRLFATSRSRDGGRVALVPTQDLTAEEHDRMKELIAELVRLREEAISPTGSLRREAGELGGRFWYFPDGQTITILCTPLSDRQLGYGSGGELLEGAAPITAYSRPSHPNHIELLRNGDIDALVELVGHIRAENPSAEVRWTTYNRVRDSDELTGHLIILGGSDYVAGAAPRSDDPVEWFIRQLELPVSTRVSANGDPEFDTEFVVTISDEDEPVYGGTREETYQPRFLRQGDEPDSPRVIDDGLPTLEYDLALIARRANPLNVSARITICAGIFSRGTYGAVRALTDANLRVRNERYLEEHFPDINQFWVLFRVPVYRGARTVTPDLERTYHQVRYSIS